MRLRIAQRLKEAQNTCAMLTTFNEIDMRWEHLNTCHVET
jgi:pyruvate/2-oxoglutarate dehydrogenase complex dihydrolipoamide acyltransferase (E2) component